MKRTNERNAYQKSRGSGCMTIFIMLGLFFILLGIFYPQIKREVKEAQTELFDRYVEPIQNDNVEVEIINEMDTLNNEVNRSIPQYANETEVYEFVDIMPEYPGGLSALRKEVKETFLSLYDYPSERETTKAMVLRFVVKKDGTIGEVTILKSIEDCEECDDVAIQAISTLNHLFIPGREKGVPVNVYYTLPIIFPHS